jgi:hypothetical protein
MSVIRLCGGQWCTHGTASGSTWHGQLDDLVTGQDVDRSRGEQGLCSLSTTHDLQHDGYRGLMESSTVDLE